MNIKRLLVPCNVIVISTLITQGCSTINDINEQHLLLPAEKFDLSQWKINTPTDSNNDGIVDEIGVNAIRTYQHPDFFYLDADNNMVFAAPNKAITSVNSTNTRSELHHMLGNGEVKSRAFANNFALKSNRRANEFAQIGGNLQATLKVNHVSTRAKYAEKPTAFSVVVGQVHAVQDKARREEGEGYGWGNEPLKIYYKKLPGHEHGSVFWNYERNLAKNDPNRTDISYSVWGKSWLDMDNPGAQGIALNEAFSYEVNVYENTMYLTFTNARLGTVNHEIDLTNNIDAHGNVDELDSPTGYTGEGNHFKAGAYNQCSTKDDPSFRYPACPGTGDWTTDKANGDYTQVTFMRLETSNAKNPKLR
jgi:poly(beta-D-mannuronate) lyase